MRILVDMDDTIEGLLEAWTDFIYKEHGLHVDKDEIKEWDMRKAYPMLTAEQIYAPLFDERMWQDVKPFPDSVEYLQKLIEHGHDVVIVTASHYNNVGMKMRNVLLKHFPFIPYENVIIATRKQMILGDVLVDDSPRNLIGGSYKGILFEAAHNREFNAEKYHMRRARTWSEVYDIIAEMEQKELDELIDSLEEDT